MNARIFFRIALIVCLLASPLDVWADVMSSTNYRIFSDVLSVGGAYSSSANYGLFDTMGESAVNPTSSSSSNFEIQSGFWGASSSTILGVSFDSSSINLGTLSSSQVNAISQVMTVSTNSFTGYTTTIKTDGALTSGTNSITAVSDGAVTGGSAEYGIRTSGTDAKMNSSDVGISTTAQILAQSTIAVMSDQTIITYKASIESTTPAGNYTQIVTFTTTANF